MRLAVYYFFGYNAVPGYLVLAIAEAVVPQRFELTPDLLGCGKASPQRLKCANCLYGVPSLRG